jgi:hypothetical protein
MVFGPEHYFRDRKWRLGKVGTIKPGASASNNPFGVSPPSAQPSSLVVGSAELGANAYQARAGLDARLAGKARGAVAPQDIEQLFFLLLGGRE